MTTRFMIPPKAPSLPDSETEFSRSYQNQLNNILRLYFNRLDGVNSAVLGTFGGQFVDCPNGLFFNTADQVLTAPNAAESIEYNQTYLTHGVRLLNNTEVHVDVGGIYNFQFSGQLASSNASAKTVYIWIKRNNNDIGFSTHAYTISGNGTKFEISWNFNIDLSVGDFLELAIATTDTTAFLDATAATAPHPGIPSSVLAVNFIAPLPAALPTPP